LLGLQGSNSALLLWGEPTGTRTPEDGDVRFSSDEGAVFGANVGWGTLSPELGTQIVMSDYAIQAVSAEDGAGVTYVYPITVLD
jgi:hypothetical protein